MGLCTSFGLAFYWPTDIDPSGPFKGGPLDQIFTLINDDKENFNEEINL